MWTFDASNTLARASSGSGQDLSITIGTGADLVVLGIIVDGLTVRTGGAPTFDGNAMTQSGSTSWYTSGETNIEHWYYFSPGTGSKTIHIPTDNSVYISAVASSYIPKTGCSASYRGQYTRSVVGANPTTSTNWTGNCGVDLGHALVGSGADSWSPSAQTGTTINSVDEGAYGWAAQYLLALQSTQTMAWTFGTSDDYTLQVAGFPALPTVAPVTKWNTADAYSSPVFIDNDLAFYGTTAIWRGSRATVSRASGKYYFEVEATITTQSYFSVGLGNAAAALYQYVGNTADSWGYRATGSVYTAGSATGVTTTAASGDVVMVAVDIDTGDIWFGLNGTWFNSGDPVSGTNPIYSGVTGTTFYPFASVYGGVTKAHLFCSDATLLYKPSGFEAWDYTPGGGGSSSAPNFFFFF